MYQSQTVMTPISEADVKIFMTFDLSQEVCIVFGLLQTSIEFNPSMDN